MRKSHGKIIKSRIWRNGCDKKSLKKNGVPFLVPRKAPDFRKHVFGALHFSTAKNNVFAVRKISRLDFLREGSKNRNSEIWRNGCVNNLCR